MSSWGLIKSGARDIMTGVAGLTLAAVDKAADLAQQAGDKLDELAVDFLLDGVETDLDPQGRPKYVTQDEMVEVARAMGYPAVGKNTWLWLDREYTREEFVQKHDIELRRDKTGAILREDLKRIVDSVEQGQIRLYGPGKVKLLTALTAEA